MNIRVHSNDLQTMMKTIRGCIDSRVDSHSNIEIRHADNRLSIRGTNGSISGAMSVPLMGGDGETFCVDGAMFDKVVGMCGGEVRIEADGNACTVHGVGKTRLPILKHSVPPMERVAGKELSVPAETFRSAWERVKHAVATDTARLVLTGVLMEGDGEWLTMVALDGFQMSTETFGYTGDAVRMVVPGAFMGIVARSVADGEALTIRTDGTGIEAETECMRMRCALLSGEYMDWEKILPEAFRTESLVKTQALAGALKSAMVVNSDRFLVKISVGEHLMTVRTNSQVAEFSADVDCDTQGPGLDIAFNAKYLMSALNSFSGEVVKMMFNGQTSPVVVGSREDGEDGVRLVLPVRISG